MIKIKTSNPQIRREVFAALQDAGISFKNKKSVHAKCTMDEFATLFVRHYLEHFPGQKCPWDQVRFYPADLKKVKSQKSSVHFDQASVDEIERVWEHPQENIRRDQLRFRPKIEFLESLREERLEDLRELEEIR